MTTTEDLHTTENLYYGVSDRRIVSGEGLFLYDADGNEFLDCSAGTFNLSLGYRHPAVVEAIKQQADNLIHVSSSFQTEPINHLATTLAELAPGTLNHVHTKVSSGSAANEGAIKMAQLATGRTEVITLFRAHVGQTMAMTSLSGNAFRKEPFPALPHLGLQVPDPYCKRCFYKQTPDTCGLLCADRIEDFIDFASRGQVAALLIEPISGNGGNIVPPEGYLTRLRSLCDEAGIKLIFDEIQTGIGRTGKMFASDHFGVTPDAITVAKGLGGTGAQVAAIIADDDLSGMESDHHSFTYGSNLLAAAAANATLEIVRQPAFLDNVTRVGDYVMARMRDMQTRLPVIGDVRGVGLMIGFEIVTPDGDMNTALTNHLAKQAPNYGILMRTSRYGRGNVLKIRPALNITLAEAEMMCDRIDALLQGETS